MALLHVLSRTPRGCVDWNLPFYLWWLSLCPSHPSWVRGLKLLMQLFWAKVQVAPLVGAWIETTRLNSFCSCQMSHPSWVRGLKHAIEWKRQSAKMSHPSWVRGLKLVTVENVGRFLASHPSWVRGLKPYPSRVWSTVWVSHPSWVRGLKPSSLSRQRAWIVAPLVGAWIETSKLPRCCWPRWVAPLVGAWIETVLATYNEKLCPVAPLVGAWIETHIHLSSLYDNMILPLLYICFLKGTIMLFAGHICTISRHFYSISFYKNGLRKYPSPCCRFQISADV